jgi:superfamily II DNA or RNA helicase
MMPEESPTKPGNWLWSTDYKEAVQLIEIRKTGPDTFYRVWIPGKNIVSFAPAGDFIGIDKAPPIAREEIIYRASAGKILEIMARQPILSPVSAKIIPLPHQIHALTRAFQNEKIRVLLADEVGLGKTIEAGLIIRELKIRNRIKRVLIIAPKGLVGQWIEELRARFNEDFRLILPDQAERMSGDGTDIWRLFDQVVVPLDSVKPLRYRKGWTHDELVQYNHRRFKTLVSANWDLVVIDEAHKLAGTSSTVARHKLARGIASAVPHLLLLSATPHQGKTDAFIRLMSLLDRRRFFEGMNISHDAVAPLVIRTEKRMAVDLSGKPLFKPRHTRLMSVRWSGDHALQKELYQKVEDYIRTGYNKAKKEHRNYIGFLMVLMQRLVSSSTHAITVALENRLNTLNATAATRPAQETLEEDFWDLDPDEQLEFIVRTAPRAFREEYEMVTGLLDLARKCRTVRPDAKAEYLQELLHSIRAEEHDPETKFLIFTEFVTTQEMLKEFLTSRGFSVACLNGQLSFDERRNVQREFAEKADIMISTEAGGEGLNLQFCHVVVNYDIPWNPMRLEQRIGRVDRIGQGKDVRVFNFLFSDTIEERIHQILMEKLQVILQDLGFDKISDILDSSEAERRFEDLYLKAILEPDRAEDHLKAFIKTFSHDAESEQQSNAILGSGQTIDIERAREYCHHLLPVWLESMVVNYLPSHGGTVSRSLNGYDLVWNDGWTIPSAIFSANEKTVKQGTLVSLTNKRITEMLQEIPRAHPYQQYAAISTTKVPSDVRGIWSLWLFVVRQDQDHTIFAHSFFRTSDGSNLATTANAVWEALARGDFTVKEQPHVILQTISSSENEALGQCEEYRSEIRQPDEVTTIDFFPVLYVSVEGKDA